MKKTPQHRSSMTKLMHCVMILTYYTTVQSGFYTQHETYGSRTDMQITPYTPITATVFLLFYFLCKARPFCRLTMDLIQVKFNLKRSKQLQEENWWKNKIKYSYREERTSLNHDYCNEKRVVSGETGQSVTGHDQECKHAKQEESDGNVPTNTHIQTLTEDLIFREVRLFRKKLSEMKMVVSDEKIGLTSVALTYFTVI